MQSNAYFYDVNHKLYTLSYNLCHKTYIQHYQIYKYFINNSNYVYRRYFNFVIIMKNLGDIIKYSEYYFGYALKIILIFDISNCYKLKKHIKYTEYKLNNIISSSCQLDFNKIYYFNNSFILIPEPFQPTSSNRTEYKRI